MIAVLGIEIEKINELLKSIDFGKGVCEVANDNSNGQVIISGTLNTVESLVIKIKRTKSKKYTIKSKCTISLLSNETCGRNDE